MLQCLSDLVMRFILRLARSAFSGRNEETVSQLVSVGKGGLKRCCAYLKVEKKQLMHA